MAAFEATPTVLRDLLVARYSRLSAKLRHALGNAEAAEDALQSTYLKLANGSEPTGVRNAEAYVMRVAINVASDQRRAGRRLTDAADMTELPDLADPQPDPSALVQGRRDLAQLEACLRELPERRRAVLIAARVEGVSNDVLAERYGVSRRLIEMEIARGLEFCARRMNRP